MRDSLLVFEEILEVLEDHDDLYNRMNSYHKKLVELREFQAPETARDWRYLSEVTNLVVEGQDWRLRKKVLEILTDAPVVLIEEVYEDRNLLVQLCVKLARANGMEAGVRKSAEEEDGGWPVLTICLPEVGEVAWHIPRNELICDDVVDVPYDGHDNKEKAARIRQFLQ